MPIAQLEQSKVSADGVERFVWFSRDVRGKARWNRTWFGPAFEM
jgi:hypothetical protein